MIKSTKESLFKAPILITMSFKSNIPTKLFIVLLSLVFVQGLTVNLEASAVKKSSKSTKKAKKTKKRRKASKKKRLVPPPPPYAPSILPELAYSRKPSEKEAEEKPTNRYAKYIYHRDQNKIPTPVRSNGYVTTWGKG